MVPSGFLVLVVMPISFVIEIEPGIVLVVDLASAVAADRAAAAGGGGCDGFGGAVAAAEDVGVAVGNVFR